MSQKMKDLCEITICRRKFLLQHFESEPGPDVPPDQCCDNCRREYRQKSQEDIDPKPSTSENQDSGETHPTTSNASTALLGSTAPTSAPAAHMKTSLTTNEIKVILAAARQLLAKQYNVTPDMVATDAHIDYMAAIKPQTQERFAQEIADRMLPVSIMEYANIFIDVIIKSTAGHLCMSNLLNSYQVRKHKSQINSHSHFDMMRFIKEHKSIEFLEATFELSPVQVAKEVGNLMRYGFSISKENMLHLASLSDAELAQMKARSDADVQS